jgi:hypothetical protein
VVRCRFVERERAWEGGAAARKHRGPVGDEAGDAPHTNQTDPGAPVHLVEGARGPGELEPDQAADDGRDLDACVEPED